MRGKPLWDIRDIAHGGVIVLKWPRIAMASHRLAGRRAVFAAATVIYLWQWLAAVQLDQPATVELGLNFPYQPSQRAFVVTNVMPGSPAERAGSWPGTRWSRSTAAALRPRRIKIESGSFTMPGDSVRLTVVRPDSRPTGITGVFRRNSEALAQGALGGAVNRLARNSLPLAFAAVGLVILFWRPEDRNVWLLACFFAGIIAASAFPEWLPNGARAAAALAGGLQRVLPRHVGSLVLLPVRGLPGPLAH